MWENRNHILHNTLHPAALRERDAIDALVRDQFHLGIASLLPADHFLLLRQPLDHILTTSSIAAKLQWLELVDLGRLRFTTSLAPAAPSLQQQRLRAWLLPS